MKHLYSFVLAVVLVGTVAVPAHAATISLGQASRAVSTGQRFTVTVTANPTGATITTARANVSFDPAVLEVTGFTFASGWLPVAQPGYDAIDNAAGALIKTGGIPGGFNTPRALGTATFRAKQAGTATIAVTGATLMLDGTNANLFTGGSTVAVTVRTPAPVAATASPDAGALAGASVSPTPLEGNTVGTDTDGETADLTQAAFFLGLTTRTWGVLAAVLLVALAAWRWNASRRNQGF
ncbi:MAG: cohesin domain-containing protein [Patescibacteria group bacterium]